MKIWPFVAAAALVAFLVRRRRHLEPPLLVGGFLVAVGLCVYGSGLVQLPNIEEVLLQIGETLGQWTYLLVPVLAFLETGAFVGLLAPGETAMILGGVVAGQGEISVITLIGLVWIAAILGDGFSFWLGRRLGREFLVKHGPKFRITPEVLERVEGFFEQHGGKVTVESVYGKGTTFSFTLPRADAPQRKSEENGGAKEENGKEQKKTETIAAGQEKTT